MGTSMGGDGWPSGGWRRWEAGGQQRVGPGRTAARAVCVDRRWWGTAAGRWWVAGAVGGRAASEVTSMVARVRGGEGADERRRGRGPEVGGGGAGGMRCGRWRRGPERRRGRGPEVGGGGAGGMRRERRWRGPEVGGGGAGGRQRGSEAAAGVHD
ncbi:hypothetical protein GUJ93_ZPchr0003g16994 [Zizania palustris]|uniref:Uncharacterized protein n=1 Tax=Zizania palustris TaxID=103762 RepID=A0A8J5SJ20_ZIZPA|nr:hypothetical protein GUJ93_ZPchr0003g16994 [Zizania palustris]